MDPVGWMARADLAEERGETTLPYAKKLLNDLFRQTYIFLQNLVKASPDLKPTLTQFNTNHTHNYDGDLASFVGVWMKIIEQWSDHPEHVMRLHKEAYTMCQLMRRHLRDQASQMQFDQWCDALGRVDSGLKHDLTEALRRLREASPRRRDAVDRMYNPVYQYQLTPPGDGEQIEDDGWPVADHHDVQQYYASISKDWSESHQFFNLVYQRLRPNMTRQCRNAGARYINNWYTTLSL
jgi:hypothetical protein